VATEPKTKELIRPIASDWWRKNPSYLRYMIREVASLFIAGYCVFLLILMYKAVHDPAGWQAFYASLQSPLSKVLHLIVLVFAIYHSTTTFDITPQVFRVYRGDEKVPDGAIAGAHYAAWGIASLILIIIALVA
jgi:fumarate reductase subunit C